MRAPTPAPGVEIRHQAGCASRRDGACNCRPGYRAIVKLAGGRKLQRTFPTLAAAKRWREDARVDLRRGTIDVTSRVLVREATEHWLSQAQVGTIRNRSGEVYKPSALRGYEQALRDYIVPELGAVPLSELHRRDVQRLVDDLVAKGRSASTVRNALLPLRALCRRALLNGDIRSNPTQGLELPAQRGRRDRVASPTEAAMLIAALPARDRPLWATAMYAGLRLGELQALEATDIDLKRGLIRVERSWDRYEGVVQPKSKAGVRAVPIVAALRAQIGGADFQGLAFGRSPVRPFSPSGIVNRAHRVWREAGLTPINPHECRHTFATLAIAAGVNIKALQVFMGHASITVTLDRYGHLLPGSEREAVALLDAYISS